MQAVTALPRPHRFAIPTDWSFAACLFSGQRKENPATVVRWDGCRRIIAGCSGDYALAVLPSSGIGKANRAPRTAGELRTANFSRGLRNADASSKVSASSILARAIAR